MVEEFVRKPSTLERCCMDMQDCHHSLTISMVLELAGVPDTKLLNNTLDTLLKTHYSYNLRFIKGKYFAAVSRAEFKRVNIKHKDDIPYVKPIDFRDHTVEFYLYCTDSGKSFLSFNFFHGVTDGHGAVRFIYDFFAVLRGEKIGGLDCSVRDIDILKQQCACKQPVHLRFNSKLKDALRSYRECEPKPIRRVFTRDAKAVIAPLSVAAASFFENEKSVIISASDIRRYYAGEKFLNGNLSQPFFLYPAGNDSNKSVHDDMINRLKNKEVLNTRITKLFGAAYLPSRLRKLVMKAILKFYECNNRFITAAFVTNVGNVDEKKLANPYFDVVGFESHGDFSFLSAFSVGALVYKGTMTLTLYCNPKVSLATAERAAEMFKSRLLEAAYS